MHDQYGFPLSVKNVSTKILKRNLLQPSNFKDDYLQAAKAELESRGENVLVAEVVGDKKVNVFALISVYFLTFLLAILALGDLGNYSSGHPLSSDILFPMVILRLVLFTIILVMCSNFRKQVETVNGKKISLYREKDTKHFNYLRRVSWALIIASVLFIFLKQV